MTSSTSTTAPARRPFSAGYENRGWGIALTVFGVFSVLAGFSGPSEDAASTTESNPVISVLVGLGFIAWGIYLLRGRGTNPKVIQRRQEAEQRQAAVALAAMDGAIAALREARGRAGALIAHRNLVATTQSFYPHDYGQRVEAILAELQFDKARIESPAVGSLQVGGPGELVEVFRDFVIKGQEGHDVNATTKAQVYVDGAVQVTSAVVPKGRRGKTHVVNTAHDMRTAQLQVVSADWSMSAPISPDHLGEARRIADQLSMHVESLKPRGVTAADMSAMVETILNNTGQPVAEKLTALANLRYDRLLSDEQFERAKLRILGID